MIAPRLPVGSNGDTVLTGEGFPASPSNACAVLRLPSASNPLVKVAFPLAKR